MSDDTPTQSSNELDRIIAEYLASEELGNAPPPDEVVTEHPDLADELRKFFANRAELAAALPNESPSRQFVPPKVRYFGDYELLDEIARGGMGVVYRANQTSLNRVVAVKMILSGHLAGEEDVKRFKTEAEAAANLQHAGIVAVHEVGLHEGQHYFSMDYIVGRSLAEIVRENPLPARKAARYVQSIAEAVHYAHQQGTLHRDLKPSNILVDADDRVHVTDFGLAVRVEGDSDLTRTGQVLGTPAYMPPEQAQGKRGLIGPASDVYSLGVILYELLVGRPPFKAESSVETLQQVIERDPVSPRVLNPNVPRDVETICLKCLRKEPAKRYASAATLAEDLGRWLGHQPILARPVSRSERVWLWCRRRPAIAGSIAAILVTACIVFGLILAERHRDLRVRAKAAVVTMSTAPAVLVPRAIADLEESPRELVVGELRKQFEMADESQRLPLAYALAHFGDVRVDYLISQVEDAMPGDVGNFVEALANSRQEAVSTLAEAARRAAGKHDWRLQARLAMLALHLQAPALARDMCQLRPSPKQRTWFIEECTTWHGDLSKLDQLVSASDDEAFRSGIVLSAGGADVSPSDRLAWEPVLLNWHTSAPDGMTHSATGWTLRQWGMEEPELTRSVQPAEGFDWYVNSIGLTMIRISAKDPVGFDMYDSIEHSFLIADREVTRGQFLEFASDPDSPDEEKPQNWDGAFSSYSPTEQHPAIGVSWNDAARFCNWLSRREGLTPCYSCTGLWPLIPGADGYRLPIEAEWEYACRAGSAGQFCCGSDESILDRYAVFNSLRTEIPGSLLPNGWGLFDVHGNVREWCQNSTRQFGELVVSEPAAGERGWRTLRGGSFIGSSSMMRLRTRTTLLPWDSYNVCGFRVARPLGAGSNQIDYSPFFQALVQDLSQTISDDPKAWSEFYELAGIQRFLGNEEDQRNTCRQMLNRFAEVSAPADLHELLMAHLFYPGCDVTPEILDLANQHAESGNPVNQRMLGLAHYRRGEIDEALPLLEGAISPRAAPNSRIVSLLSLALVQLHKRDLESARTTIGDARTVQDESPDAAGSSDRKPWGVIPSLWREVAAAMAAVELDEPIPELPPAYTDLLSGEAPPMETDGDSTFNEP